MSRTWVDAKVKILVVPNARELIVIIRTSVKTNSIV